MPIFFIFAVKKIFYPNVIIESTEQQGQKERPEKKCSCSEPGLQIYSKAQSIRVCQQTIKHWFTTWELMSFVSPNLYD
jgi:hypothetical protein